ncbi:hypothetical protein R6Q59_007017 [Mikania micrantha]
MKLNWLPSINSCIRDPSKPRAQNILLFPPVNQLLHNSPKKKNEAYNCMACSIRNSGDDISRNQGDDGGDMQRNRAFTMHTIFYLTNTTIQRVLHQIKRAEAMPLWLHKEPILEAVCYFSLC